MPAPFGDDEDLSTKNTLRPNPDEHADHSPLPPDEEAKLLAKSAEQKARANTLFARSSFDEAIHLYTSALGSLPSYCDFEAAVLRANIAACHLKLGEWKDAVSSATEALEALERVDPSFSGEEKADGEGEKVREVDEETAGRIEAFERSGRSREDVQKMRVKALLRRAKARMELGGWAALQGADEDYKQLASMPNLMPLDRKTVEKALRELPPRLEAAKQKEMGEMMGKLKQLGNGILKPFGLSTDNFNMVKDEATGGYSMQFNQNR